MLVVKQITYECQCGNRHVVKTDDIPKAVLDSRFLEVGGDFICMECGSVMKRTITTGEE